MHRAARSQPSRSERLPPGLKRLKAGIADMDCEGRAAVCDLSAHTRALEDRPHSPDEGCSPGHCANEQGTIPRCGEIYGPESRRGTKARHRPAATGPQMWSDRLSPKRSDRQGLRALHRTIEAIVTARFFEPLNARDRRPISERRHQDSAAVAFFALLSGTARAARSRQRTNAFRASSSNSRAVAKATATSQTPCPIGAVPNRVFPGVV